MVAGTNTFRLALVLALPLAPLPGYSSDAIHTFDAETVGRPPSGFVFRVARESAPARWVVQREGVNNYLAHLGEPSTRGGFSLALLETPLPDGATFVSARTRRAGHEGSIGVVWRVQDADNYYLARLDLSRQDIGLYRVVRGNRVRIEGEDDLELDPDAWHTLKIVQKEADIRVYIGGIRVLRARDRTFGGSGAAGVWSTGDALAHFDDVRIGTEKDEDSRRGR
jgi:hypothetical protein